MKEALDDLLLAPAAVKPKKEDVAWSQAVLLRPGVKWSPSSSQQKKQMLLWLAQVSLYQAFLTSGAGVNDLHIVAQASSQVILYARRDLKLQSLNLLPFSGAWVEGALARPANSVPSLSPSNPTESQMRSLHGG